MRNKKGISPLIATVLLIGFTIVLAALVMRWGGTLFKTTTSTTGCESQGRLQCTSTQFVFSGGAVNYNNGAGSFVVNNEGTVQISKVIVQREDNTGAKVSATRDYATASAPVGTTLDGGESDTVPLAFGALACASVKTMYATPVIKYQPSDGSSACEITCTEQQAAVQQSGFATCT